MAKFTCGISGLRCEVSYLPISLDSREYAHPIFFLPQKKLLGLVSKYEHGELGDIESYLLYLALFNSTDLVEFRVPASYDPKTTPYILANGIEPLAKIAFKLNAITVPSFQCPKFVITPDTKNLSNSLHWIHAWESSLNDFMEGNRRRVINEEIEAIEARIYRMILDPNVKPEKHANTLAIWAAKAASFPEYQTKTETIFGNMSLCEYWQLIIRKCVNEKAIFDVPAKDIAELIEHCETNLELGTIYSHSLLNLLRDGREKQISYLGLGNLDEYTLSEPFVILEDSDDTGDANLISVINSAPTIEPKRMDYKSEFDYQRARIRYLAAKRNSVSRT
jgi:hypothetical protein